MEDFSDAKAAPPEPLRNCVRLAFADLSVDILHEFIFTPMF